MCFVLSQDERYDSRKRSYTTSYAIVYGRTRCKLRSYTIVFRRITWLQNYDRTSSCRIRRNTTLHDQRKRPYTIVYDVVCHRICAIFSLVKRGGNFLLPPSTLRPPLLSSLPSSVHPSLPLPCPSFSIHRNTYRWFPYDMDLNKK